MNTTAIGQDAEQRVCDYLSGQGYWLVARNFRTRYYEIDIIVQSAAELVFVEVKYRKNADFGGGEGALNKAKLTRLIRAGEDYLANHSQYNCLQPRIDLVVCDSTGGLKHYRSVTDIG